jgi:hypothetical protein
MIINNVYNPIALVLAIALYKSRNKDAAGAIFEQLAAVANGSNQKSILAACASYETQLSSIGTFQLS